MARLLVASFVECGAVFVGFVLKFGVKFGANFAGVVVGRRRPTLFQAHSYSNPWFTCVNAAHTLARHVCGSEEA